MCQVHPWSWYNLELWPQGQIYRVYDMLCVQASAFLSFDIVILCLAYECITMVQCVTYIHELWPWPLTSISELYFHSEFESGKMSLLLDIGIPNFGKWMYHHETTWPDYELGLWPICEWLGGGGGYAQNCIHNTFQIHGEKTQRQQDSLKTLLTIIFYIDVNPHLFSGKQEYNNMR